MKEKKTNKRILLKWICIIVWAVFAVYLSRQTGSYTSTLSYGISEYISEFLEFFGVVLDIKRINYFIRKAAHVLIYFVWGILVYDTIASTVKKAEQTTLLLSVSICLITASLDEVQKLFIPGRHCDIGEIALNSITAVLSILLVSFIRKKKRMDE